MTFDENSQFMDAIPLYKQACQHFLDLLKETNLDKHKKLAVQILDRVEKIKPLALEMKEKAEKNNNGPTTKKHVPIVPSVEDIDQNSSSIAPESKISLEPLPPVKPTPSPRVKPSPSTSFQPPPMSKDDISAIKRGSKINGNKYSVFREDEDVSKYFKTKPGETWTDPDGFLQLDPHQDKDFSRWVRGAQYFALGKKEPVMISGISAAFIKQSKVGDCSFISSLCVAANYESRFRKQLITSIIYPKDENGIPMFNPAGKYMVKLWFNGAFRKVFVDDFLPTGNKGTLLCSQSTRNELWVSIIEKAYVKVNGGYDFPGSNGGIDQFALTNWIPQTHNHRKMDREKVWRELHEGIKRGSCLVTAGTYSMTPREEQAFGLASAHAYAVLNTAEVKGIRLLQLKNPWSSFEYRGKFSIYDKKNMTMDLRRALEYGTVEDELLDGGVFWIDYNSFCNLYEQTDVSWDPKALVNRLRIHRKWTSYGPRNDSIMLLHNPQYRLTVKVKGTYGVVWLVLSRHYFRKSQILSSKDRDALGLLIFDHSDGDLILTPTSGTPVTKIKYTNYPHILVRLSIPGGVKRYSLVISAVKNDPKATTNYTLSVLGTENAVPSLSSIPRFWPNVKRVKGNWDSNTAGGRIDKIRAYQRNPMFAIKITKLCKFRARLSTYRTLGCNISFFHAFRRDQIGVQKLLSDGGGYSTGFAFCEASDIYPGTYIVVPSTFDKDQAGPIVIELECTEPFEVEVVPS